VKVCFLINFSSFKPDAEYNANFENYASHCLSTWRHSYRIRDSASDFFVCLHFTGCYVMRSRVSAEFRSRDRPEVVVVRQWRRTSCWEGNRKQYCRTSSRYGHDGWPHAGTTGQLWRWRPWWWRHSDVSSDVIGDIRVCASVVIVLIFFVFIKRKQRTEFILPSDIFTLLAK